MTLEIWLILVTLAVASSDLGWNMLTRARDHRTGLTVTAKKLGVENYWKVLLQNPTAKSALDIEVMVHDALIRTAGQEPSNYVDIVGIPSAERKKLELTIEGPGPYLMISWKKNPSSKRRTDLYVPLGRELIGWTVAEGKQALKTRGSRQGPQPR